MDISIKFDLSLGTNVLNEYFFSPRVPMFYSITWSSDEKSNNRYYKRVISLQHKIMITMINKNNNKDEGKVTSVSSHWLIRKLTSVLVVDTVDRQY